MSIVADIKQARAEFETHAGSHKCRNATSARADGIEPCAERLALWQAYVGTAALWGIEPDDERRQREHFERNLRPAAA